MPNWCNNSIKITGPVDQVKALWEQAQANWKNEQYGLLDAMVPMPDALKGTTSPSPDDGSQPEVDGYTNWYDWSVANWGTKWDINNEGIEFEDNGDGTAQIAGWFESAWAPPIEAYNTFIEDMDGCSLVADYHEPGMDFAGFYDNGDDEYMEGLGEYCSKVVKGEMEWEDTPQLFQRLDEQFELVENAREWIEEEMEQERRDEKNGVYPQHEDIAN